MGRQHKAIRGTRATRGLRPFFGMLALLLALTPAVAETPATGGLLAEVDGEAITADEVEKAIGAPLRKLEEQIYTLKRQKLEALVTERILAREAAKRGLSVPALLDIEGAKAEAVTEQEIDAAYQAQKDRGKGEEALLRAQIGVQLQGDKIAARTQMFLESLRSQAKVTWHLDPPPIYRAEVSVDGAPSKGLETAQVTIVEFQDFHCPFCERVQPTLARLMDRYGERIRLVYRDFPIDQLHPQARKAHEAARCANDQGKFWPYHDVLFAKPKRASPEDLKAYAREAGLNIRIFERCLASRAHQAQVQKDVDDGIRAGVTGTPSFFINGRLVSGALPLERFVFLIDEELARTR